MKRISLLVAFMVLAFSSSAFAKIGVLDFQKVLTQSKEGKAFYLKLKEQADDFEKKLNVLGDEINSLQEEYKRQESTYREEAKEKKRTEIQRKIRNFNTAREDYAKELKKSEGRGIKKIQDEVIKITQDLGKELQYEIVLEAQSSAVLYMTESVNITNNVIKRYDNEFDAKK